MYEASREQVRQKPGTDTARNPLSRSSVSVREERRWKEGRSNGDFSRCPSERTSECLVKLSRGEIKSLLRGKTEDAKEKRKEDFSSEGNKLLKVLRKFLVSSSNPCPVSNCIGPALGRLSRCCQLCSDGNGRDSRTKKYPIKRSKQKSDLG